MTGKRPPERTTGRERDRGQAFTLEGFIAAVVVLSAILLALQAVVITPSSSGQVDDEVRQQLAVEARDILVASAHNGSKDLSYYLRLSGNGTGTGTNTWERAGSSAVPPGGIGYGSKEPFFHRNTLLGNALNETFTQRGFSYNLVVEYLDPRRANETETVRIAYRGVPTEEAVSVTYTLVLYDNESITGTPSVVGSDCTDKTLEGASANETGCYPIPEASLYDDDNDGTDAEPGETTDSPIYNVIEVRVVVW